MLALTPFPFPRAGRYHPSGVLCKIPGLKEDYKSLNLHINIAELIMEGSGAPDFRKRWQTERAMLEGEDCCEVQYERRALRLG